MGIVRRQACSQAILEIENVNVAYSGRGSLENGADRIRTLSSVSFEIRPSETLGLVGESGSGKTTVAHAILQLVPIISGSVRFRGTDISKLSGRRLQVHLQGMQVVFQDPLASLNPKWRVMSIVEEPLAYGSRMTRERRRRLASDILDRVGLPAAKFGSRLPIELSGGQCQRVAIARAVVNEPNLVLFDEALSSLDAIVQQDIFQLLVELREERSLSYLFISHDLAAVRRISHRVAVMYAGQLVEVGPTESVCARAAHPYSRRLFTPGSSPLPSASTEGAGSTESGQAVAGCRFRNRCPHAIRKCVTTEPRPRLVAEDHVVSCHITQ